MKIVVSNTGPILHLVEAKALNLLSLTGNVFIPPQVLVELSNLIPNWQAPSWLQVISLQEPHNTEAIQWQQAGLLDAGEAEALALTRQLSAAWFLTDDAAARLLSQQLGHEVHGSLGIVLWAAAVGHLSQDIAEATLDQLFQSTLWVSPKVKNQARITLKQLYQP